MTWVLGPLGYFCMGHETGSKHQHVSLMQGLSPETLKHAPTATASLNPNKVHQSPIPLKFTPCHNITLYTLFGYLQLSVNRDLSTSHHLRSHMMRDFCWGKVLSAAGRVPSAKRNVGCGCDLSEFFARA